MTVTRGGGGSGGLALSPLHPATATATETAATASSTRPMRSLRNEERSLRCGPRPAAIGAPPAILILPTGRTGLSQSRPRDACRPPDYLASYRFLPGGG